MSNHIEPSSELRTGRRALEELPTVELLDDWHWYERDQKWVLHCRLTPEVKDGGPIPDSTDWYVLVDASYPTGSIKFYPSKSQGLKVTFPHQLYNDEGQPDLPWRTGELCLVDPLHILGRPYSLMEPLGENDRLKWHFQRALDWLMKASNEELVENGDPFELPDYPTGSKLYRLAFAENQETYETWTSSKDRTGVVLLSRLFDSFLVARVFLSLTQKELVKPDWGRVVMASGENLTKAIWIRLDSVPVLSPWQAPATWGQLRQVCMGQNIDLDACLQAVAKYVRDGDEHALLLGFPISKDVGGPPCQFHWLMLLLPVLSHGHQFPSGFRPNEQGYWYRDRNSLLTNATSLNWGLSENWDDEQLTSRGRLPATLATRKFALIGAGAFGSAISEILVRAGVRHLTLVDPEITEVGNLVRHTLTLADMQKYKASALADRLNLVNPHAKIHAICAHFPSLQGEDLRMIEASDVIIDCTASNDVLHVLNTFAKKDDGTIFSFSIGFNSTRLYCFAAQKKKYNDLSFHEGFEPWQDQEVKEISSAGFPREGIGCWHPVFPARADDVWLMASTAMKYMEYVSTGIVQLPDFTVFIQERHNGLFTGLRRFSSSKFNGD